MPIKNVFVLWIIFKQLFKCIFHAFSVNFCVSPWASEGILCRLSTHLVSDFQGWRVHSVYPPPLKV